MAASTFVSLAPDTWIEVAADAEDFDLYNPFEKSIEWGMGASAPPANDGERYHAVLPGARLVRGVLTDKVYCRHSMNRTIRLPIIK